MATIEIITITREQFALDIENAYKRGFIESVAFTQGNSKEDPSEIISIKEWAEANGYTAETLIARARERHIPITQYPKNRKQFGVEARYKYELLIKPVYAKVQSQ